MYSGKSDNAGKKVLGLSYGPHQATSQLHMQRMPIMKPLQPKTQMVYSHPQNISRNQLSESEPLSPYSEIQLPMPPKRQTHQVNPMSSSYFYPQETLLQSQLGTYPQVAISNSQNTKKLRMMETRSQRIGSQDVSTSPYAKPLYAPHLSTVPQTPGYKVDQSLVFPSTSSSTNGRNKKEGLGYTMMDSNKSSTAFQDEELAGNNHIRFLIGSIDQVINWNFLSKKANKNVIYEVTGILENIAYDPRGNYFKMIIRDNQKYNSILHAQFFPIDRDIPSQLHSGGLFTFTGCMKGAKKLQVFNMWPTNANSLAGLKRVSFLCQRTLQEACMSSNEP